MDLRTKRIIDTERKRLSHMLLFVFVLKECFILEYFKIRNTHREREREREREKEREKEREIMREREIER